MITKEKQRHLAEQAIKSVVDEVMKAYRNEIDTPEAKVIYTAISVAVDWASAQAYAKGVEDGVLMMHENSMESLTLFLEKANAKSH